MWMATLKTLCFVVCVGNINRMEAMVVKCGLMWAINYQVALIKTSHRANIKTETLSKIWTLSTTVIRHFFNFIIDECVHAFSKHKNRRLVNIV